MAVRYMTHHPRQLDQCDIEVNDKESQDDPGEIWVNKFKWARAKCSLPNNVDMHDATLSEREDGRRLRAEECGRVQRNVAVATRAKRTRSMTRRWGM
eukprot:5424961-Heterocapsa_arctica.AAC.1